MYVCMYVCMRGRLYSSFVQSSMLHGSETWSVRKENDVALQRAEMSTVRWMGGIKLQHRVPSKGLRERVPGQKVDQRKLGERLWKKTARHVN